MDDLVAGIERIAVETGFSGAVRVDVDGSAAFARAYGLAHRGHGVANTIDTRFGIASATKGLTALTVVRLIEEGRLALGTAARSVLGDDLPSIGDDVTVEHLLAHRSGIGDYLDEGAQGDIDDYAVPVPVHELATTEQYVRALDGHPQVFRPGERFAYNNGGFVVLALIAERVAGVPFADLVVDRVCAPAGLHRTGFPRSDALPGDAALGYLTDGDRTNVFHLPVVGSGDGGAYSTLADVHALWAAFFAGRVVAPEWVAEMVRPRSDAPEHGKRYGLGFWLAATGDAALLEGYDAGVSFRTRHDPTKRRAYTVVSNTSEGAWPLVRFLDEWADA